MAFQGDSIFWVELAKIVPNPFQPRREFDEGKLKELAESVRMYGILQPLTVTRREVEREDGTFYSEYELIAGERRMRAAKLAGLEQVPVIIRDGEQSEQEKLELAIIENLQREDLNAVDRALAFKQLAEQFSLTNAEVARKVGRSREYVSNTIRLLALPDYMLESLKGGDITEGHARTLLMLNDKLEEQDTLYREILLKKLSVREVERIARKIATDKVRKKNDAALDPSIIELEKQFTESLGTRVQIAKTDYGGRMTIDYFAIEDLEEMLARLKQEKVTEAGVVTAVAVAAADEVVETNNDIQAAVQHLTSHTPLEQPVEADVADTSQPETTLTANSADDETTDGQAYGAGVWSDDLGVTDEAKQTMRSQPNNPDTDQVEPTPTTSDTTDGAPIDNLTKSTDNYTKAEPEPEPVEAVTETEEPSTDTTEIADQPTSDDSSLYAIRNFSV